MPPLTPPGWNPGTITRSVTQASTQVPPTDIEANSTDPAIDTANGLGCVRTLWISSRTPRRKTLAGAGGGATAGSTATDIVRRVCPAGSRIP